MENTGMRGVAIEAIEKLAFFGTASVSGSPSYAVPRPTLGDMQRAMLASPYTSGMPPSMARRMSDRLTATGLPVSTPAKSVMKAAIGGLAGNFIANALGTGPFMRGVMTAAGAGIGYNR